MEINWSLLLGCSTGIVGFIEWLKSFDKENKIIKKISKFVVLIFSIGLGILTIIKTFTWIGWVTNSLIILGKKMGGVGLSPTSWLSCNSVIVFMN